MKNPLSNFCRALFGKRPRSLTHFPCARCGVKLALINNNQESSPVRVHCVVSHACIHLNKELFKCNVCNYGAMTLSAVKRHGRRVHKRNEFKDFVDLTDKYQDEIKAIITECFGDRNSAVETAPNEKK